MTGRFILPALLLLLGCAEPKYAARGPVLNPSQKTEGERAEFSASKFSLWLVWEKLPAGEEFGSFILKTGRFNEGDKSPLPLDLEGELAVVLWMPSMGHGSSPVTLTKVDTGTYRATKVFFTMPGEWEIRVRRLVNGAVVEQAVVPFRL